MSLVPVTELLNKSIYASARVPIYSSAGNNSVPISYAERGTLIGIVDSWLSPNSYRSEYWLMIKNGSAFRYVKFSDAGKLSLQKFQEQGARTVKEIIEQEKENNETFGDKAIANFRNIAIIGIVAFAAIALFGKFLKK